jgi:hypothetical protein
MSVEQLTQKGQYIERRLTESKRRNRERAIEERKGEYWLKKHDVLEHRFIDCLNVSTALEESDCLIHVRSETPVDEKSRDVLHDNGNLALLQPNFKRRRRLQEFKIASARLQQKKFSAECADEVNPAALM